MPALPSTSRRPSSALSLRYERSAAFVHANRAGFLSRYPLFGKARLKAVTTPPAVASRKPASV